MNVFGIGLPEMALIMVIALLVFGPKKLPEIGRSFGKAIRGFQDASKEFEAEFKREAEQIEKVSNRPPAKTSKPAASEAPESMEATLEPSEPKALAAMAETSQNGAAEPEAIAQSPASEGLSSESAS